jgi:hypothetical protein
LETPAQRLREGWYCEIEGSAPMEVGARNSTPDPLGTSAVTRTMLHAKASLFRAFL